MSHSQTIETELWRKDLKKWPANAYFLLCHLETSAMRPTILKWQRKLPWWLRTATNQLFQWRKKAKKQHSVRTSTCSMALKQTMSTSSDFLTSWLPAWLRLINFASRLVNCLCKFGVLKWKLDFRFLRPCEMARACHSFMLEQQHSPENLQKSVNIKEKRTISYKSYKCRKGVQRIKIRLFQLVSTWRQKFATFFRNHRKVVASKASPASASSASSMSMVAPPVPTPRTPVAPPVAFVALAPASARVMMRSVLSVEVISTSELEELWRLRFFFRTPQQVRATNYELPTACVQSMSRS